MSHSRIQAGVRAVPARIRDHAEAVIELDPELADGGGLRLLGRLHTAAPRVPMVSGWIDRERGIELLRRACRVSTADPRNPLFLAEALLRHRPAAEAEAVSLLRQVAVRRPDPEHRVEQSETLERARSLLREIERG